jgi:hypothetical protein
MILVYAPGAGLGNEPPFDRCRSIADSSARLRCYDAAGSATEPTTGQKEPAARNSPTIGSWRLVRTPDPRGGPEAISIMRSADPLNSESEFVGLMLRCGHPDIQVLSIVIPPLPPRSRPIVTVGSGPDAQEVVGQVTPPGAAILLPGHISAKARVQWPRLNRIEFTVSHESGKFRGAVELTDFSAALEALTRACASRPPDARRRDPS